MDDLVLCDGAPTAGDACSNAVSGTTAPAPTGPCQNLYLPGVAIPASYGAAYNVLSAAQELLVQGDCSGATPVMKVGSGSTNQDIYNTGYAYKGGSWQAVTLTSATPISGTSWFSAHAQGPLPFTSTDLTSWSYMVAYICTWIPSTSSGQAGAWKCGCADAQCTTGMWQLQGVKR